MEYANFRTQDLMEDAFIDATVAQRGTWVSLMLLCCRRENNGRLIGAKDWDERKWCSSCALSKAEVENTCSLYFFDGKDLIVLFYPQANQDKVQKMRSIARENGRLGGRKKNTETNIETNIETEIGCDSKTEIGGKNKNKKEKEKREDAHVCACETDEVEAHLRNMATSGRLRLHESQVANCALAYWSSRDAVSWKRNGVPITNWRSDATCFAMSWADNHPYKDEDEDDTPLIYRERL